MNESNLWIKDEVSSTKRSYVADVYLKKQYKLLV